MLASLTPCEQRALRMRFGMNTDRTLEEGLPRTCRERFRPILMTTLAALLGAVPLW